MPYSPFARLAVVFPAAIFLLAASIALQAGAQVFQQQSSGRAGRVRLRSPCRRQAPSLVDPAGPTISLVSSEPVFMMAAALNACGYDEGLEDSAPIRKRVRDEINDALAKSEDARAKRDKALPVHRAAPDDGHGTRHFAVHLAGALSQPAAGAGNHGGVDRDAARLDAGGGDCSAAARFCAKRSTCMESGWRRIAPTTKRPTSCTIRCRR